MTAGLLGLLGRADAVAAPVLLVAQGHADRHEDLAVGGEDQPRHAEAADPGVGDEDVLDVGQGVGAVEAAARQHRRSRERLELGRVHRRVLARVGLQVREVDQPVLGEPRMHGHVPQAQPAAVGVVHLGHAADGLGIEHAVADDPQAAGALGDQDVAVRQEVHGRRTEEALDGDDTEPLIAEAQDLRLVGQGVRADPPASLLRVADGDEQAHREDDEERGRPSRRACERHGEPPNKDRSGPGGAVIPDRTSSQRASFRRDPAVFAVVAAGTHHRRRRRLSRLHEGPIGRPPS